MQVSHFVCAVVAGEDDGDEADDDGDDDKMLRASEASGCRGLIFPETPRLLHKVAASQQSHRLTWTVISNLKELLMNTSSPKPQRASNRIKI